jgi:hypothetical protein
MASNHDLISATGSTSSSAPCRAKYEPLVNPSCDLRLLRVFGKRITGRLQVQTWNESIAEENDSTYPEYRCLSYTWGDPDDLHDILVGGHVCKIRRNLCEFLERAAQRYAMQQLWIDALCIDQESTDEKSIQVARMGSIYSKASEVLVWLGQDPALFPAVEFIKEDPSARVRASIADVYISFSAFWDLS